MVGVRWGRQKWRWVFIGTLKKIQKIVKIFSKNFENSEIILEISANCRKFQKCWKIFLKIPKIDGIFQKILNISKKFLFFT